jgi:hypothetical protein
MMKPQVPEDANSGGRYVSDVLEGLLVASETRAALRAYCVAMLDDVAQPLSSQLESIAAYVGGKCMGYPAVWFLECLLAETGTTRQAILERAGATIAVSLSTSIVDDLADGDEPFSSAYLAFLYVLIGRAAFVDCAPDARASSELYRALEICLNPHASIASDAIVRRGERIGAFFRLIAGSVLDGVWPEERVRVAVAATGAFGEICAHIDDWMDAERDFARGVEDNVVLALLRERVSPQRPTASDIARNRAWLRDALGAMLMRRVTEIAGMLKPLETHHAIDALSRVLLRLPATLDRIPFRSRSLLRSV